MRLKEIAEKYGISYKTVYEATYYTPANNPTEYYKDWDEKELISCVINILADKIKRKTKSIDRNKALKERLEEQIEGEKAK